METSAPVLGRRTRTFTSEAASTTFSSVIKVAMTVLATEASSPALLRMTMHFLQLLDKVCSVGNLFLCRCASHAPKFSPSGLDVVQNIQLYSFDAFRKAFAEPLIQILLSVGAAGLVCCWCMTAAVRDHKGPRRACTCCPEHVKRVTPAVARRRRNGAARCRCWGSLRLFVFVRSVLGIPVSVHW